MKDKNMELSIKASIIRKKLGEDTESPIDLFTLVQSIDGMTILLYPLGHKISGVCIKLQKSSLIAINSMMSLGRQRFSLAHELYHYYYDEQMSSSICSTDIGLGDIIEREADMFASFFLIPPRSLYEKIEKIKCCNQKLDIADLISLEQYYGVSRQAILYRLIEDNVLTYDEANSMKSNVISTASKLGYDTGLYKSTSIESQRQTLGYYIKKAEDLFDKEIISYGKYEELLLDAFREDIVYGEEMEGVEIVD